MLYYDGVNVSEGIDANKTSESKECDIWLCWCFLDKRFKFQPYVCNECHDVLMMSMNLSDIVILSILTVDYCYIISRIGKSEAANLLQKAYWNGKIRTLKIIKNYKKFLKYI